MTTFHKGAAPRSNHTERSLKLLRQRVAHVASYRPYVSYLHLVLDRASLPASTWALPNVTNMAAMVAELQCLNPDVRGLNSIVLGRFLHRVLSPLLTWHGEYHECFSTASRCRVSMETTTYRFPVISSARASFEAVTDTALFWRCETDQWLASTAIPAELDDLVSEAAY